MYTDTEGIIFRHVKTVNRRRMISIFSKKYGKISAGTSISERGKSKSTLAMKPFTYGKYELYKNRDNFNINGAETIKSYYKLGEDIDKYINASYILEFTEKLLPENMPQPKVFNFLIDFLDEIEKRKKKHETLIIAYKLKVLNELGYMPELNCCVQCGRLENLVAINIREGGIVCQNCIEKKFLTSNDTLIYEIGLGIIKILRHFISKPLKSFENLALEDKSLDILKKIVDDYAKYYLDMRELKSEEFLFKE